MGTLSWMKTPNYGKLRFGNGELASQIPGNFMEPDTLFDILIQELRKYHPSDDLEIIHRAYNISKEAHQDQRRKSGEPYIIHPICVAIILAQLEMDKETIVAGILHDVVEDTKYTVDDKG